MRGRAAGLLLVGGLGCAGAPPSPPAQAQAAAAPRGVVAAETEPAAAAPLPLWARGVLVAQTTDADDALPYPLPGIERRAAALLPRALRCVSGRLDREPTLPASLRIDFALGPAGDVASLSLRGTRSFAWPCLQGVFSSASYDAPPAGRPDRISLALFFRPSSLSWGQTPALRPLFEPRERGDAPREPHQIAYDHGEADFLWSLGGLRRRLSPRTEPATALEQLLAGHRAAEVDEPPEDEAVAEATREALGAPSAAERAAALLLLARQRWLRGDERAAAVGALLALVCGNLAPLAPGSPPPLPQEHSDHYWRRWEGIHLRRASLRPGKQAAEAYARDHTRRLREAERREEYPPDEPASLEEETRYIEPFAGCVPAPGATRPMRAEAWAMLGDLYASNDGRLGGVYFFHRAASAYVRSLEAGGDDLVRLQLAWLRQRAGRHRAAAPLFAALLLPRERATGEDALLRDVALQALAASMIEPEFDGQPDDEPFFSDQFRLDQIYPFEDDPGFLVGSGSPEWWTELKDARLGERALARVHDPSVIPPGAWFARPLLLAMGRRLVPFGLLDEAAALHEQALAEFPLHRDAPAVVAKLVGLHARQALIARPASPEHASFERKRAAAMERFSASFLDPSAPWRVLHRDDDEAVRRAVALGAQLAAGSR